MLKTCQALAKISAITMSYENDIYRHGQKTIKAQLVALNKLSGKHFSYQWHNGTITMKIPAGLQVFEQNITEVTLEDAINLHARLFAIDRYATNTKIFRQIVETLNFIKILDENYNIPIF